MTNGSLKYEPQEIKGMKMEPGKIQMTPLPPPPPDILQDFKQEPDNEFADLVSVQKLVLKSLLLILNYFRISEVLQISWRMMKTS